MKNILFFIFLFFTQLIFSQKEHEFFGAVKLNDTSYITYRIKFVENNGRLEGYSITDFGGNHETKSKIKGSYSNKEKRLSFKEYDIVYTKSPVVEKDFCFIHFNKGNVNLERDKTIQGNFKGLFSDNTKCIDGELFLNAKYNITNRIEKLATKINKSKTIEDSLKEKVDLHKSFDRLQKNVLKKDQTLSFFSTDDKVKIKIFDDGHEDDDRIALFVNGKIVLDNYTIKKTPKFLTIELDSEKTSIELKALNNGEIARNTAVFIVYTGDESIETSTYLNKGESTKIEIYKKDN